MNLSPTRTVYPGDLVTIKPHVRPILNKYFSDLLSSMITILCEDDLMLVVFIHDFDAHVMYKGVLGFVDVNYLRRVL